MGTEQPRSLLPNLRLDELLAELQVRLQAVVATRDRVNALFEAVMAVGTNLDIEIVLRGIVQSAVSLVDARYGAMGVIGDDDRLAEFIPVGLTEDEIGRIHHWPEGHGLLGALISYPESDAHRGYQSARAVVGLSGGPPSDDLVPGRAHPHPR